MLYNRRRWLQQSLAAAAVLGVSSKLPAMPAPERSADGRAILLNSNENPYGPSPLAQKAILEHYMGSNRYPDDHITRLISKIAGHWAVAPEHILTGAGSSEIIGLAALHVAAGKKKVILAEPGYQVWTHQAAAFGLEFIKVPLNAERKTDLQGMLAAIDKHTAMVYISNPNNPTGTAVSPEALTLFATEAARKTLVFIDEAYTEYAGLDTLANLATGSRNIIVAKTFSKIYGLAGARCGYAISNPALIKQLSAYQAWPNASVSAVAAAAAIASLDDDRFVKETLSKTAFTRQMCTRTFRNLGLEFVPGNTNFILFNIDRIKQNFDKEMAAKQIFVQTRDHFNGKWCRVSLGTMAEMQAFCDVLHGL
jgi:histidinol-phosphate aminotransferase